MPLPKPITAIVFDAYGTLFDVHSVVARCDALFPGQGQALSLSWREKQLQYTWLRSLMGRYQDFAQLTRAALYWAAEARGLELAPEAATRLLDAYLKLAPYPEVPAALAALAARPRAILSNGTRAMLEPLAAYSGLAQYLDAILSVEAVGIYKPDPRVYGLATEHYRCPADEILFVSANGWDAAGAKSFGFATVWVNRAGAPLEQLGAVPDAIVADLAGLPPLLPAN
ncbi:MAG: haloacid dehalogenase type II [Betaproteobacteria bacterium]|nr:haloacid dehalogenase type II [Betaproteobacteria bacterium]